MFIFKLPSLFSIINDQFTYHIGLVKYPTILSASRISGFFSI